MKVYRDLTISGSPNVLISTIVEMEQLMTNGWKRDRNLEELGRRREGVVDKEMRFCFTCDTSASRKGARLYLMSNDEGNLSLSNIVPEEFGQLTHDEFNDILGEFLGKFVEPAVAKTGASVETSCGKVTIDDWFSKETADKLRRFMSVTHGSTAHPSDQNRWMSFLVAARNEGADVSGDLLQRWLIEDAGCDETIAQELASAYQTVQDYERSKEHLVGA